MQAIFISYRREDASGHAGRLFDDLAERLGKKSVFMDVAGIQPGRDFRKVIHEQVGECGVLLAVIGPRWVDARDSGGRRRLDNPADYVRLETATALQRDIPVVPVLVNGAQMMQPEDLPPDLADLAYRNAFELRDTRWRPDIELLAVTLRAILEGRSSNDTMTLRPLAAMPPAPEPAPALAPAVPPPARRTPALWAGAGLAAVGAAGAAFLALRPPAPADPAPPGRLVAAAPLAAASAPPAATATATAPVAASATVAAAPALVAASAPVREASAPAAVATAPSAPAATAVASTAASAPGAPLNAPTVTNVTSATAATAASAASAALVAAAGAAVTPALPAEPTAAGPAASPPAPTPAPTPVATPSPSPASRPVARAPAAPPKPARAPANPATPAVAAGANAVSTLTVKDWKISPGGCGGPPVSVKGVATFTIEAQGHGVRVTQRAEVQDQGWTAHIAGEAHFDAARPGDYEVPNRGEWVHAQGRRFNTEARAKVSSPDGLKAASARGISIRSICPSAEKPQGLLTPWEGPRS